MKTVLVVDDSPEDREAIIRILAQDRVDEYSVLEAYNEATCLAHLSETAPVDCVLLDYSMPGCDGLELLKKVIQKHPDSPVIMITGEGSEDIAVEALKLGAQDNATGGDTALRLAAHTITADGMYYERDGLKYIVVEQVLEDQGIVNLTHEDYDVVPSFAIPEPK
jgi:PleD family two-component response regulator